MFDDEDIYGNYAVGKILDAMYEKMDASDVVKMQTYLNEQQQGQFLECSPSIPRFLEMTLAAILKNNSTLISSRMPGQCIDEPILCQNFTRTPSRKNKSIWYVSACSLLKAAVNGDCPHSSHPRKMAGFDGLVTFVN
jgi:hypothetical protein